MSLTLRNGIFLAPFHPVEEDPTLCIQRDLELIEGVGMVAPLDLGGNAS